MDSAREWLRVNIRKIFATQLATGIVCSNAWYIFGKVNLLVPAMQATLVCTTTFLIVRFVGKNASIAVGSAVWVGLLSLASLLLAFASRPSRATFDAGIYDRGPLFLGIVCASLCLLFWKLLPWEPLEEPQPDDFVSTIDNELRVRNDLEQSIAP